ncbi:MAG: CoA transferase [Chloroflexi bacterium]|nr:CoA transferase [Chloroflexota bacterium]
MAGQLPLEGVKVADFSWVIAGPLTTKYLAIFGAQVVRIESHSKLDRFRLQPPFVGKPSRNSSLPFADVNVSKMSLCLNLNKPRAVDLAKRLVAWADVVTENFSAGQMASWGLGYDDLRRINPGIIMLSSSQLGQTGPNAGHPGIGNLLQAHAGVNHMTGWPDRDPTGPAVPYPDMIGPWFSIVSIVAALEYRDRTGKGQYLDLSQHESTLQFISPALLDYGVNGREGERRGNESEEAAPHNAYPCRGEDAWCAISVRTDAQWEAFGRVLGPSEAGWVREPRFGTLINRLRHRAELDEHVSTWTRERDAGEVMRSMQEAGVPASVVASGRDLHEDPQLRHRGHFAMVEHPRLGSHPCTTPAFHISDMPPDIRPAPSLGQDTEVVCREILGLSESEYAELADEGVFS